MNCPIAMIPYANMAPFAALGPPPGCYFVHCAPRQSIRALQSGAVRAAAVPVGGLDALQGQVVPIGRFGIAAYRHVMSVLFFSRRPLDEFGPAMTVRLTGESASSVRLLYLLLRRRLGADRMPRTAPPGVPADGELVIGDTALKWLHLWEKQGRVKSYAHMADLAEWWDQLHQLPFVFARWVVRTDAPERVRDDLALWLQTFAGEEPALIERCAPAVAARLELPEAYARRYLKLIRRCLTPLDEAGQALFQDEWAKAAACGTDWLDGTTEIDRTGIHSHG